jgi:hypothetical protein
MNKTDEALKLALEALESERPYLGPMPSKTVKAITAIKQALAAQPAPAKIGTIGHIDNGKATLTASILSALQATPPAPAPVRENLSKRWKWVLHKSFADVAGFDEDGIPSFYWQESVTKFKSGELSVPCKGKNCGSMNGWLHSVECRAEHEAQYTTQPAQPATEESSATQPAQPAPVQEPVAIALNTGTKQGVKWLKNVEHGEKLYIIKPAAQRQWVGLTEQEAAECWSTSTVRTWQAIEAKLREKNT